MHGQGHSVNRSAYSSSSECVSSSSSSGLQDNVLALNFVEAGYSSDVLRWVYWVTEWNGGEETQVGWVQRKMLRACW